MGMGEPACTTIGGAAIRHYGPLERCRVISPGPADPLYGRTARSHHRLTVLI